MIAALLDPTRAWLPRPRLVAPGNAATRAIVALAVGLAAMLGLAGAPVGTRTLLPPLLALGVAVRPSTRRFVAGNVVAVLLVLLGAPAEVAGLLGAATLVATPLTLAVTCLSFVEAPPPLRLLAFTALLPLLSAVRLERTDRAPPPSRCVDLGPELAAASLRAWTLTTAAPASARADLAPLAARIYRLGRSLQRIEAMQVTGDGALARFAQAELEHRRAALTADRQGLEDALAAAAAVRVVRGR